MDTGAEMLVTMCPFCQGSFNGNVKKMGNPIEIAGVDALMLEAMGGDENGTTGTGK